jgi:hypothetical protein
MRIGHQSHGVNAYDQINYTFCDVSSVLFLACLVRYADFTLKSVRLMQSGRDVTLSISGVPLTHIMPSVSLPQCDGLVPLFMPSLF